MLSLVTARTDEPAELEFYTDTAIEAAEKNAAARYLAGLAAKGRRPMLIALNRSASLLSSSRYDARTFPWQQLTHSHVQLVRERMAEQNYSAATVNQALSALKGVALEAYYLEQIDGDTLNRIKHVKGIKATRLPAGRALAGDELTALFAACQADECRVRGTRDAALFSIMYSVLASRRSEVVGLNLDDYDPATGAVTVRRGKGNKERLGFVANDAQRALNAWVKVRQVQRLTEPDGSEPLFVKISKGGRPLPGRMTDQGVYDILQARALECGLSHCTPHSVRRSAISDMLDNGTDISTVARAVGHSGVSTTVKYDRRGERAIKAAAQSLQVPVGGAR